MAGAVTVAYVHQHECAISWHHSVIELLSHDMGHENRIIRGGWIAIRSGTDGLVESRNMAVRTFLAERVTDWLFWVDTDMGFAPDLVDRLYEAADPVERPMVGALAFTQRELESDGMGGWRTSMAPTVFDWTVIKGQHGFAVRWDFARNTLVRCAGTGSACVLIHRSVFEKVEAKFGPIWYDRVPNTDTGQLIGEDLSFCLRCGAESIPIHVHTGVEASHKKEVWLTEEHYWRQRLADAAAAKGKLEPEVAAAP